MESWFWWMAAIILAGCAIFAIAMWRQRGPGELRNHGTDEQRLTEMSIRLPPD
jgi:hypothetical protein